MNMNEIGALLFVRAKVYPTKIHTKILLFVNSNNNKKNKFFRSNGGTYTSPSNFSTAEYFFIFCFFNKLTLFHGMVYIAVEQEFLNQYLLWSRLFY